MLRLIPYLTLPLTIFTLIAIILINIGGVNSNDSSYYAKEKNSAFNLVNWNYTVTPVNGFDFYEYHIYLNRFCTFSQDIHNSLGRTTSTGYCRNSRIGKFEDGKDLYSPNGWIQDISPFQFSTVNLTISFAFYVLTAIWTFVCVLCAPFGGKRLSSLVAMLGTIASGIAMICILIASAVLTRQMLHLKDQIEHNTRRTSFPSQRPGVGNTTEWINTINNASVGSAVLGLTWASVVMMILTFVLWVWTFFKVRKETSGMATKQQYVQG